ncbi:MAG: hypothetical protein JWM07_764 [Candidatus Saccharibacteria bacterium]|nr:hypothetical protein [Candidatus Saccharibacteria bacterium]
MSSATAPSQWTRLPGKLTASILRLTQFDLAALGVLSLVALILYRLIAMPGLILGVALIYLLMMQLEYLRRYDQLFFVLPETLWFRYVRRGKNWTPKSKKSALIYQLKDLPRTDTPGRNVGLGFNVDNPQEVSVVITGSGSHIASMSISGMWHMHQRIANDLSKISIKRGLEVTVGFVMRPRPWDEYQQRAFEQVSFNGNYLYPKIVADGDEAENVTDDDRFHAEQYDYNQEVYDVFNQEQCTKITMATVVTIRRKAGNPFKKASNEALYEDEVAQEPILQIATRAAAMLHNRTVQDVKILDLAGLREYFREAWDAHKLADYRRAAREHKLTLWGHWPEKIIRTTKSYVQTDKTHHGLIRITATAEAASPTHLLQLFGGPSKNRTVSMVTQSMRSKGDYLLTGIMIDISQGIRDFFGTGRLRPGAKAKARERQEHEETSYNTKFRQLYDYWIPVAASSPRELQNEINGMLEYFDGCNEIEAKEVRTLEPLLYRMVWRALTGVM